MPVRKNFCTFVVGKKIIYMQAEAAIVLDREKTEKEKEKETRKKNNERTDKRKRKEKR